MSVFKSSAIFALMWVLIIWCLVAPSGGVGEDDAAAVTGEAFQQNDVTGGVYSAGGGSHVSSYVDVMTHGEYRPGSRVEPIYKPEQSTKNTDATNEDSGIQTSRKLLQLVSEEEGSGEDNPYQQQVVYQCTLESSECLFNSGIPGITIDFIRSSGRQGIHGGRKFQPRTDRTTLGPEGRYMYADVTGKEPGVNSGVLITPLIKSVHGRGEYCVSYWYFMSGRHLGFMTTLASNVSRPYRTKQLASHEGGTKGQWEHVDTNVYVDVNDAFMVLFTVSQQLTAAIGGFAVDDVSVTPGPCGKGSFTPWGEWGLCSSTCGHGITRQTRSCRGEPCKGPTTRTRSCENGPCQGVLTEWGPWLACSVSCGNGTSHRSRGCHGGLCDEPLKETRKCQMLPCSGTWSQWSEWTLCSVTCGLGTRQQTRRCEVTPCTGRDVRTELCQEYACQDPDLEVKKEAVVMECEFERDCPFLVNILDDDRDWQYLSGPTPSGDTGPTTDHTLGNRHGRYIYYETSVPVREYYKATLMGSVPNLNRDHHGCLRFWFHMYGLDMGTLSVLLNQRQIWSQTGNQGDRWLEALIDLVLEGDPSPTFTFVAVAGRDYRSDIALDDVTVTVGKKCNRTGWVTPPPLETPESQPVSPPPFEVWGPWSKWSECSTTCGEGLETRYKECREESCDTVSQARQCSTTACNDDWYDWTSWTTCSTSCDTGTQRRNRACKKRRCIGKYTEVKLCGESQCVGSWGAWSLWGPCSATCGPGSKLRQRSCSPANCARDSLEIQACEVKPC